MATTPLRRHTAYTSIVMIANLPTTIELLRSVLGEPRFAECVAAGEAMELAQAVQYARGQIQHTPSPTRRPTLITAGWPAQVTEREQDSRVSVV